MSHLYPDRFRQALAASHAMTSRGELWRGGIKVKDLMFIAGSVSADRSAATRRTLSARVDPALLPTSMTDTLTPYGTYVKAFRGVRYPDRTFDEECVFYGRIDAVDMTTGGLSIRASDLSAGVIDYRFEKPYTTTNASKVLPTMTALIRDVYPGVVVDTSKVPLAEINQPTGVTTWDRERGEALDRLAAAISCEWYVNPAGEFHIAPVPTITPTTVPVWHLDAGEGGVLISTDARMERQNIHNAVIVNGTPADKAPVYHAEYNLDDLSPLKWGEDFGKVPRFYTSEFIYTKAQAEKTAKALLASELSATRFVNVSTIPNPKLMLSEIVGLNGAGPAYDGLYYVSSFDLPLGAEEAMRLALYTAIPEEEEV